MNGSAPRSCIDICEAAFPFPIPALLRSFAVHWCYVGIPPWVIVLVLLVIMCEHIHPAEQSSMAKQLRDRLAKSLSSPIAHDSVEKHAISLYGSKLDLDEWQRLVDLIERHPAFVRQMLPAILQGFMSGDIKSAEDLDALISALSSVGSLTFQEPKVL